jgi:hypothetical protein
VNRSCGSEEQGPIVEEKVGLWGIVREAAGHEVRNGGAERTGRNDMCDCLNSAASWIAEWLHDDLIRCRLIQVKGTYTGFGKTHP